MGLAKAIKMDATFKEADIKALRRKLKASTIHYLRITKRQIGEIFGAVGTLMRLFT